MAYFNTTAESDDYECLVYDENKVFNALIFVFLPFFYFVSLLWGKTHYKVFIFGNVQNNCDTQILKHLKRFYFANSTTLLGIRLLNFYLFMYFILLYNFVSELVS